jgi:hypothetical protein
MVKTQFSNSFLHFTLSHLSSAFFTGTTFALTYPAFPAHHDTYFLIFAHAQRADVLTMCIPGEAQVRG